MTKHQTLLSISRSEGPFFFLFWRISLSLTAFREYFKFLIEIEILKKENIYFGEAETSGWLNVLQQCLMQAGGQIVLSGARVWLLQKVQLWTEGAPVYCFRASVALNMIYTQPNSGDSFETRWMKRTCADH